MFYCYILLDPTKPGTFQYENFIFEYEPFYVGKGIGNRINVHDRIYDTKTHKRAKIQKIKKLGLEVIKIKLFEDLTESSAFDLEKSTISIIGRRDKVEGPLLNLTDGGEGSSGKIYTDDELEKKSNKTKEWWYLLKEDREKYKSHCNHISQQVSIAQKGISYDERHGDKADEMRAKRSEWAKENFDKTGLAQMDFNGQNNPMFGKSIYDIWVEKYGEEEANQRKSEWIKNKSGKPAWNSNNQPIQQKDLDDNPIRIWEGLSEIHKETGFSKPNICKVLKGNRKIANGFKWEYVR